MGCKAHLRRNTYIEAVTSPLVSS